jgi:nucleoside-diphosphate-sugar epimerase
MKSVVVTGGSGKAGRAAIAELLARGYAVVNADLVATSQPLCHFMKVDFNDLGQTIDALRLAPGTIDRRRTATANCNCIYTSKT